MKRRSEQGREAPTAKGIAAAAAAPSSSSSSSSSMGQAASSAGLPQLPAAGGLLSWFEKLSIKNVLRDVFICYASLPFIIRLFPSLLRKFVYLNFISIPFWTDFHKPEVFLGHTQNFYLTPEPGITLGIWHTLPDNRWKEAEGKDLSWYQEALADDNPVIIYLHGNGGTRATGHRVSLAKVMSGGGFHVLSVDHRGISTNTARHLKEKGIVVDAIVLEAPFTNIRDAAAEIPITKIYRKFPGFESLILDTMARAEMYFPSDQNVKVLSSPILILHAEDDVMIPVHQGRKLFEIARNASEKKENIQFIPFPSAKGFGHDHISSNPELPDILKDFLKSIK
ncbi:protein ABHD12B isoform X2 [Hemicordylus capensis]|uniref:protein ABHD12B isoform X2 n=1 Tax=Hemicordylus capensis TaxID=884348 RepID=UPI002303FB04|nr:protein ABHD12B isoform X2 [Hemicordylus capensis]